MLEAYITGVWEIGSTYTETECLVVLHVGCQASQTLYTPMLRVIISDAELWAQIQPCIAVRYGSAVRSKGILSPSHLELVIVLKEQQSNAELSFQGHRYVLVWKCWNRGGEIPAQ